MDWTGVACCGLSLRRAQIAVCGSCFISFHLFGTICGDLFTVGVARLVAHSIKHIILASQTYLYFIYFSVQYAVFLYRYLKEWLKNPHWSCSCCLSLVLPFFDLQGEIGAMVETNILNNQLGTGSNIERPSILSCEDDSCNVVVGIRKGEQIDNREIMAPNGSKRYVELNNTKCHQGTQTEPFLLSVALIAVHKPADKTAHEESL